MFRIYFVTFWGPAKTHNAEHAHEAPVVMLIPLIILALLSIGAGFIPMAEFVSKGAPLEHHGINFAIAVPAVLVALIGIGAAYLLYGTDKKLYRKASAMMGMAYYVIKRKFFIDEIYLFVTHKIIFAYIARPIAWFDRHVVDGGVNLSAWITRMTGTMLSFTQTGQVQTYAVWYAIGILLVVLMVLSMAI